MQKLTSIKHVSLCLFLVASLFSCSKNVVDTIPESLEGTPKCLITSFEYITSQNKTLSKNIYEFDNNYNVLKSTQFSPDFGNIITTYKNSYDPKNNLLKAESFNEKGVLIITTTYQYFKNGLTKLISEEGIDYIKTQEFNENGKLIKALSKNKSQNYFSSEKTIIYNKYNLIDFEEAYFNKVLIFRRSYIYNSKNLLIKSVITENNTPQTTEYIYDTKNRLIKTILPDNSIVEYTFSAELLAEKTIKKNEQFQSGSRYQYDGNGNLLSELGTKNGKNFLPILENTYFPNSNKIEKVTGYEFKPNSTEATTKLYETIKDSYGNDLKTVYYDTFSGNQDYTITKSYLCK